MNRFLKTKYFDKDKHQPHTKDQKPPSKIPPSVKLYVKIAVIVITFFTTFGLLFLHDFFTIRVLDIVGVQRLPEDEVRDTVNGILTYNKYYILPQNNYFLVDIGDLHTIITQKYPMKKLTIRKIFPHTLTIEVEEKLSKIIYDNGEQYSLVDDNGKIAEILRIVDDNEWKTVTKTVTSTNEKGEEVSSEEVLARYHTPAYKKIITEIGDYPLVYDGRAKKVWKGEQILEEKTIQGILEWYQKIKNETDIPLTYFYLEQELGNISVRTSEGWQIKIDIQEDLQKQFETLQYILKEKVKRPNIQYIDVRFPGRAFWL